jgi:hypothetical protein
LGNGWGRTLGGTIAENRLQTTGIEETGITDNGYYRQRVLQTTDIEETGIEETGIEETGISGNRLDQQFKGNGYLGNGLGALSANGSIYLVQTSSQLPSSPALLTQAEGSQKPSPPRRGLGEGLGFIK